MLRLVAFVALAGCDRLLGIAPTVTADATPIAALPIQQATAGGRAPAVSVTLPATPAANDALVAVIGVATGTVSSVSGGGVAWQIAAQSNVNRDVEIWYGVGASGSGPAQVDAAVTAGTFSVDMTVVEWSPFGAGNVIAGTGDSSGMSADMVTASVAPVAGSNVLFIAGARTTYVVTSPPAFLGDSPGWTALATADQLAEPAYLVVSSANGAYTNDFRWDRAEPYDTVIVAFVATAAP